jgi:hypothetical protein
MPSKMNYNTNECAKISKLVAVGGEKNIHVRWAGILGLLFGPDYLIITLMSVLDFQN